MSEDAGLGDEAGREEEGAEALKLAKEDAAAKARLYKNVGIGVGVGVGSAALVAALLYANRGKPKGK